MRVAVVLLAAGVALAAQESRTVWEGVFSEEQSKRGGVVYGEMCANCHGAELEGADMSPALSGVTFSSNWSELTVGDLAERIRISMPSDRPGSMTRAQVADVTAFLLKANKFPTGTAELPQEIPFLRLIRIVPERPAPSH